MAAFSKLSTVDYTCYELGHTWSPSCVKSSLFVASMVSKQAFVIYGTLFLIMGVIRKRGKKYFQKKVWLEILQSTLFLTTNGTLFLTSFCLWRNLLGGYYYATTSLLPGLIGSFTAILIERKSRRGMLAVYMGNVAIETLWNMLEARGWVRSIPNGEVMLFSVAVAVYLYYFKKKDGLPKSTASLFRKVLGSEEMASQGANEDGEESPNHISSTSLHQKQPFYNRVFHWLNTIPAYKSAVDWLKGCPSHRLCKHQDSCGLYVLQGALKMFGAGYFIQAAVKLLGAMRRVFKQPSVLLKTLTNWNNVQLGAFLGCFVGIFRAVNCLLRWVRNRDDSTHGLLSGFLAGWSIWFYKGPTLPLYTAAKLAEMLYFRGISAGVLPYIQCADIIIYSVSTAVVFHAAVLEPHSLRPAYWNFLLRVTGNKFAEMNRRLLDDKVPNCSKLYPNYWPNYDLRYTTLTPR